MSRSLLAASLAAAGACLIAAACSREEPAPPPPPPPVVEALPAPPPPPPPPPPAPKSGYQDRLVGAWRTELSLQEGTGKLIGITRYGENGILEARGVLMTPDRYIRLEGKGTWKLDGNVLTTTFHESSYPEVLPEDQAESVQIQAIDDTRLTYTTKDGTTHTDERVPPSSAELPAEPPPPPPPPPDPSPPPSSPASDNAPPPPVPPGDSIDSTDPTESTEIPEPDA